MAHQSCARFIAQTEEMFVDQKYDSQQVMADQTYERAQKHTQSADVREY